MNKLFFKILSLSILAGSLLAQPPATPPAATQPAAQDPHMDEFYRLGPDSLPTPGVPKGHFVGPTILPSSVFPGTQHTYFVYVPAQYDASQPTAVMILN